MSAAAPYRQAQRSRNRGQRGMEQVDTLVVASTFGDPQFILYLALEFPLLTLLASIGFGL